MGIDRQKTIRTLRLSLTCLFVFLITWYYEVPESAWSLITIWFVMYEYNTVGGVFTKGLYRFIGTFFSAVYGMVIVYCCANNPMINMIALVAGLFVYAYYFMSGDKMYIGVIGAVTLTIVLLNYNDLDAAIVRVFNIMIGVAVSMFMICFFYPQYARNKILGTQSKYIDQLSKIVQDYLNPSKTLETIKTEFLTYESNNFEGFASFHRLVNEAKIETKNAPFFIPHAITAMLHIRSLFKLLGFFIDYLSTDDIRLNPWVCLQLNQLLSDLQAINKRLQGQHVKQNIPMKQAEADMKLDAPYAQPNEYTEFILASMLKESALLNDEIKKMELIYEIYTVCIDEG